MGPRLGPLVVTSMLAEVDERGASVITSRPRGAIAKRIGDSKKLVAFEDSALGEAWARAIALRASGTNATSPRELLRTIAIDTDAELQAPCPSHHADMCWSGAEETFVSDDALVERCKRDLDRLETKGVRILRARVAIVCTRKLNDAVRRGLSRFDVDLHTMERLTLAARDDAAAEVYALCGKVGGFDFYGDRFGPLAGFLHTTLCEGRARSEYQVPGVGRLAFVRDADGAHLVVGLASLVGKWARDHLMRRIIQWHRAHTPDLPDASGYHDPVTTRFIEASALARKQKRVDDACFERIALYKQPAEVVAKVTSSARRPMREEPLLQHRRPKAPAPRGETSSS